MQRASPSSGPGGEAEWPRRGHPIRIGADDIARAARALVDAYGPDAIALMRKRTRAVRRRGDAESATLWSAVAEAVEAELAGGLPDGAGTAGD